MDNNSNQEKHINYEININGETFSNDGDTSHLLKDEMQKLYNKIHSSLGGLLSPLDEQIKNLTQTFKSLKPQNPVNIDKTELKPVIERIQEEGRLQITLNGATIVDIELPEPADD